MESEHQMPILRAILFIALCMMTIPICVADGQSRQLPVYEVSRTTQTIKVDGKLDEAAWARAPVANLVLNNDGSPSPAKTEARVLYDERFLYFSFRSVD